MKNIILVLFTFLAFWANSATVHSISNSDVKNLENSEYVNFSSLGGVYYGDEIQTFVLDFDFNTVTSIKINDTIFTVKANDLVVVSGLSYGDYSFEVNEKSKSFKYKETAPFFKKDTVVFGLLLIVLVVIFKTSEMKSFKGFYKIVPGLLLCYFIPAILNSLNIIDSDISNLYFVASRFLLPASIVLLCLSIDIKAIKGLGSKAIVMFFAATIGIVIGGPVALYIVSLFAPEVLDGGLWKGLSTVAGSWIGGGANQVAMKEIYGASDKLFSAMIIVDVFVANIFMSVLLFGIGKKDKINKFFKADDSAIEALKTKMEDFQKKVAKIPTFNSLLYMLGIVFFVVSFAHFLSGLVAPSLSSWLEALKETSPLLGGLLNSLGSGFFWLIVFVTIFGVIMSFTKLRNFEGVGASKFGSIFLYVLVATIGMKMNIGELIRDWGVFKYLITIGLIWITIHAIFIFIVAKLIKAPFFYVAVGSQANVGGAASAPVVAGAFSPSLAPVGVLLAVLGYAVGTFGAIICTLLMKGISV
jgi:uncharacterized membrane protein